MIYTITVAFCRSAQFARAMIEYKKGREVIPKRHIVVQGHYPIDTERNNNEISILCKSLNLELIDPGSDIGSAQSQQFALEYLKITDDDFWINFDPDSACPDTGWDYAMESVLRADPNCVVISCHCPMVNSFLNQRGQVITTEKVGGIDIFKPITPTPFNLSMFRCAFLKETGGMKQVFPFWGELEALIYYEATRRGKYHAYLNDYFEDESGKYFHPKSNAEWKDKHARTQGPEQFLGSYGEFLRYKYPELANLKL